MKTKRNTCSASLPPSGMMVIFRPSMLNSWGPLNSDLKNPPSFGIFSPLSRVGRVMSANNVSAAFFFSFFIFSPPSGCPLALPAATKKQEENEKFALPGSPHGNSFICLALREKLYVRPASATDTAAEAFLLWEEHEPWLPHGRGERKPCPPQEGRKRPGQKS